MRILKVIQFILALIEAVSIFVMWFIAYKNKKGFGVAFLCFILSAFVMSLLEVFD